MTKSDINFISIGLSNFLSSIDERIYCCDHVLIKIFDDDNKYIGDRDLVRVEFKNGYTYDIDVTGDSRMSMVADITKFLTYK